MSHFARKEVVIYMTALSDADRPCYEAVHKLNDFEKRLKNTTRHIKARVYVFGGQDCGAVTMTTKHPFNDWHECPTCRRMIHLQNLPQKTIQIAENGDTWQEILKEALNE